MTNTAMVTERQELEEINISVLRVSIGTVRKTDDTLLDSIDAYDRAEINDAYVCQINLLSASYFCGVVGQA